MHRITVTQPPRKNTSLRSHGFPSPVSRETESMGDWTVQNGNAGKDSALPVGRPHSNIAAYRCPQARERGAFSSVKCMDISKERFPEPLGRGLDNPGEANHP